RPLRNDAPPPDHQRTEPKPLRITIDPLEFARVEHEMAISRLRDVIGLLLRKIAGSCGNRVQHRLIDIRWLAVDQRHGDGGAAGSPWEFAGDVTPVSGQPAFLGSAAGCP